MSRHRALSLDDTNYDSDEIDYGSSYDGSYSASPSLSQYIYNRNQQQKTNLATLVNKNDSQLVAECIKSIEAIVGRDVFPNDAMVDAIRACNYNVETAIDHLYEQFPEDMSQETTVSTSSMIPIKISKTTKNKKQKQKETTKQKQQPISAQQATSSTTVAIATEKKAEKDDAPDALLMKTLGRGSSPAAVPGRGTSLILGQARAASTGRGLLTLSRGRGTAPALSLGRGRGSNISIPSGLSVALQKKAELEQIEKLDEQASNITEEIAKKADIISDEEYKRSSSLVSEIAANVPSDKLMDENQQKENMQMKPSPLAQCLIQKLTDTSFVYNFLHGQSLNIINTNKQTTNSIFRFDEPSPDDIALAAREQSKISHKPENTKFKPIVKKQPVKSNKPAKSDLSAQLEEKMVIPEEKHTPKSENIPAIVTKVKRPAPKDEQKKRINVVIIGHVDAGKSTLMGHLLVQTGMVSDKMIHKYKKESQEKGKASFAYAWILDEHSEERERGVTIDVGVRYFETPSKHVTILDAPGHRDFIPNMITGTSQADLAILVVDSSPNAFESGFHSGGQTKEHLILARSLGINEVLVVVNKLDMVDWDKRRYDDICRKLGQFMKQIGFKEKDVVYIPASGLNGINLVENVSKVTTLDPKTNPAAADATKLAQWYHGPSIIEYIDQYNPINRDVEKPFRLSINEVYKTLATGVTVAGRIDSGHVSVDDQLLLVPLNELCVVKTILRHKESVATAYAGDNVELGLAKIEKNMLKPGDILCDPIDKPIKTAKRFEARIVTFELDAPITVGTQVDLHLHNINQPAVICRLKCTLNKQQEVVKRKPRLLTANTTAIVEIKLAYKKQVIPIEKYADFPTFGRFMLRAGGKTIAAGLVTEIL
jgi:translation elongation factor TU